MKNILMMWLPSVAFMACDNRQPYYDEDGVVTVSGISVSEEIGNIGGATVEITGSGFGEEATALVVMFGNQNASVLSASDTSLTVEVPHGPVGGGAVDIRVGNAGGQDVLEGGYVYAIPGNGIESVYGDGSTANQIAYVAVANDMMSCYGGTTGGLNGCETFALTGEAGIEGRSEGLEIVYPGADAPYSLGKSGFANDYDFSWNQWNVTTNSFDVISFDDENAVEDYRLDIGEFSLKNDSNSGSWCANLPSLATFVYNGEDAYVPSETNSVTGALVYPELADAGYYFESASVTPPGDLTDNLTAGNGCQDDSKLYQLDELQFCQTDEYQKGLTRSYAAEWPVAQNFFMGQTANGQLSPEVPVSVQLDIAAANISQEIVLPPFAKFSDTVGEDAEIWAAMGFPSECPDNDDNIGTTSTDNVFNWTWEPIDWQADCSSSDGSNGVCVEVPDGIKGVNSYVKVSVSYLSFSWMGGEGVTQYASITVPDNNNFDVETGLSSLGLPTWVMYSFPTAQNSYGEQQGQLGTTNWLGYADTTRTDNGLIVMTIDRVVEYVIPTQINTSIGGIDEQVEGDLVFAYSTGDMGYFNFDNPLDSTDECGDCLDNDGDGWTDATDPDCQSGNAETNLTTLSTCNDGIDNDGDGDIDAEDANCINGMAGESADCSDNVDNDSDGWVDQDDPDCQDGGVFEENPTSEFGCNDGIDNDSDGWIDIDDLACTAATNAEDDGFFDADQDGVPDFTCNDGIDNDGHGDIDAEDIYCFRRGADNDEEPANMTNQCSDGIDNDGDGYVDNNDPACEITNGNLEFPETYSNTQPSYAVLGDCNDGMDNDCDGLVDSEDAGCYVDGVADGYQFEDSDGIVGNCNCDDASDNDLDGWIDAEDPDCNGGTIGEEVGFGSNACNDGVDNDADGLLDAFDVYCWERSTAAAGTSEAPENPSAACSNGTDDDGDGWIDLADPGCEKTNGGSEAGTIDYAHWDDPACSNGVDDDADGDVDAVDANCDSWYDTSEAE